MTNVSSDLADDPNATVTLSSHVVGEIIHHQRLYNNLRSAFQRLDLQVKAIQRHAGDAPGLDEWLIPYRAALEPLKEAIATQEKRIVQLARELPIMEWGKSIAGLSDRFLGLVLGEAGRPITDYRSPAALWKRMGMAVIDGGRQRRVTGDAALLHGFVARRRALMWNIENSILKQQVRKTEGGTRYAIGYYGQVYIDRRAYEAEKNGEKYSHARAKRYMGKRLLRELWKASREIEGQ